MNHPLIRHLPLESAEDAAVDPSTADLTGRVLHFLGEKVGFTEKHQHIQRAVKWLFQNQEQNGSWYGRWGVCYIYGTWLLLQVCMHAGLTESTPLYKRLCVGSNPYKMMTGAGENLAKAPKSKHTYRFKEEPLYKRPGFRRFAHIRKS